MPVRRDAAPDQRLAAQLRSLHRLLPALDSGERPARLAGALVTALADAFRASWVALYRTEGDATFVRRAETGPVAARLPERVNGTSAAALREAPRAPQTRLEATNWLFDDATIAAPIDAHNDRLGWVVIGPPVTGAPHDAHDAEFLALLCEVVAPRIAYADIASDQMHVSLTDLVTGFGNRRAFSERIEEELARSNRSGNPLTLLLCEVEPSGASTTHGGGADLGLATVVDALKQAIRLSDPAFRVADRQLAVLLLKSDTRGGLVVAERVRRGIAGAPADLALTVSIGLAALKEGVTHTPISLAALALTRKADEALRLARGKGGNRAVIA
ncbi:MAG: GGDEF domain-containing protein [Gemmatimonadaceae bacterium]